MIAHGRVFIIDDDGETIKYDIARAIKLEVLPAITDVIVSDEAKTTIGVVGVVGLIVNVM